MDTRTWFLFPDRPAAATVLYCLPHAGGGAGAYRSWLTALPESVAVRPVQLPGRESRIAEPPAVDVATIADVLAGADERPFALYGHSFGALLAYETARELHRRGQPLPTHLFVGACRAPDDLAGIAGRLLARPDGEFLRELVALGGTPREVADNPDLARLLLPVLRADFGWIDAYECAREPTLPVPVVAFAGTEDRLAPPSSVDGWARMTSGGFRLMTVAGGHFFARTHLDVLAGEIGRALRPGLSAAKRALLAGRLAAPRAGGNGIPRRPAGRPVPASFAQRRLWFLDQYHPGSPAYLVPLAMDLSGPLDVEALRASLTALVARHEALRTTLRDDGVELVQVVAEATELPLPVEDLAELDDVAREDALRSAVAGHLQAPFDLRRGPLLRGRLLRVATDRHRLVLLMHHTVVDGWSLSHLVNELVALYRARVVGGPVPAPPGLQYGDYAHWQRGQVDAGRLAPQIEYWRGQLAGARATELPTGRPRPPVQGWRGDRRSVRWGDGTAAAVREVARRVGATPFMVLLAGFVALLHRYGGGREVVLGTPMAGRDRPELEGVVGMMANTLVLRVDVDQDPTLEDLISRVRGTVLDAHAHQDAPFELLVERLRPDRDPARHPLFQIAFALQNVPPFRSHRVGPLAVEVLDMVGDAAKFDLAVTVTEDTDRLDCEFEYSTDLFDAGTVARLAEHYRTALDALVADPTVRVSRLPLLDEASRTVLLGSWSGSRHPYDPTPVHRVVEDWARRTPDAVAVDGAAVGGAAVGGAAAVRDALTYGELDRRANALANRLAGLGAGPGGLVAVCLDRSPELVITLLAVLKTGAAYLPLDPANPYDRLVGIVADSAVSIVVTSEELSGRFAGARLAVVCPQWSESAAAGPVGPDHPRQRAYVIYTSGSTGQPKGVEVEHAGLANLVGWHLDAYRLEPADRAALVASPGFDASAWELWSALAAGASVHIPPDDVRAEPRRLAEWLAGERITVTFLPTATAEAVLAEPALRRGSLRALLTGGDALRRTPPDGVSWRLVNHYGPTENSVVATAGPVDPGAAGPPAIGKPIGNVRAYVLDAAGEPVPVGVPGELYVGGAGVARGYLADPARTAASFVPDPYGGEPGGRLYRTGDLVRWRPDGQLDFLGRADDQVKVRGHRVELGEAEAALREHPAVRDAVVVVRERGDLAAFVVLHRGAAVPTADELRAGARRRLPSYMVPSAYAALDRLPLNPSGKVDRRALTWPQGTPLVRRARGDHPSAPTEVAVAEIWRRVLDVDDIGREDNFFDLGGHSFLALRAREHVDRTFAVEVPVAELFRYPTVATFAEYLDRIRSAEATDHVRPSRDHGERRRAGLRRASAVRRPAAERGMPS